MTRPDDTLQADLDRFADDGNPNPPDDGAGRSDMNSRDIAVHPQVRKALDPKGQEELTASIEAFGIL